LYPSEYEKRATMSIIKEIYSKEGYEALLAGKRKCVGKS